MNTSRRKSRMPMWLLPVVGVMAVVLLAVTAMSLYSVIHVSIEEDDWDRDSPIDGATKVYKNETVLFKGDISANGDIATRGDVMVAGDLIVEGKVGGTPEFSEMYTVCEGASVREGDAVSWLVAEGADPEGCVTPGFEGTPATAFTADNLVENAQVVRLADHQHTVILGYECNYGDDDDNDNFCWKKAEYDSGSASYKPGVQHIVGGISIGVETARVFSLESTEYFGIVASNGGEDDVDVFICEVGPGVCTASGTTSGYGQEHFLTSATIIGSDSTGRLILAVGANVQTVGSVVGIYQLALATAAAPYAASLEGYYVIDPNTDGGGDDHLSVQIERLTSNGNRLRMFIGSSIQDLASDGVAIDFIAHAASVSQVDGTGFVVDSSVEIRPVQNNDNFEFSITVFPGTDNWMAVYSELDFNRINNFASGNVDSLNAVNIVSRGSFAPSGYALEDLETDPVIAAITSETAVIIYRGIYRDYRLQAVVINIDDTGAFVDFGDHLQVQERYAFSAAVQRVSSKKFVIVTVLDNLIEDGQFGTILVGNLPSANGFDGLLHFGADNKGRSVFGIAKGNAGSGSSVEVVYAGQYCYSETFDADFLPMSHIGIVYAGQSGMVGTSPVVDGNRFITVFPQRIGYNRNARCIIVDINHRV